jgi:uncharacterized protein with ParB-like and HNH nuclease domain
MSVEGKSAPILSLKEYLIGDIEERLLVVPPWQREYVWKPTDNGEIGILLEDLKEFINSNDDDYLMGSILLSKTDSSNTERLLIDGQQRTLTYSILIMAILKHVQNSKNKVHHLGTSEQNAEEDSTLVDMRNCVSLDYHMYEPRVSMPHSKANDMLQSIFYWSKVADGEASDVFTEEKDHWTQTQKNLIDVAIWLYEKKIKTESWLPNKDLLKSLRKILDNVKFMQLTLSTQQEAIAIFDRINSRGALLDSGDLIKNRIFQAVDNDEDFEQISQSWLLMNDSLAKCSLKRMREPKFLLRAMALSDQEVTEHFENDVENPDTKFSAPKITYEKLTTYWGDRLDPKNKNTNHRNVLPMEFADDLVEASQFLSDLSVEKHFKEKPLIDLYFARYLNSVQHFPMLLAGRFIQDYQVVKHLARQVHNRTAYYLLSEERTQDYESLVPTWSALISKLGPKATIDSLNEIYNKYVVVKEEQIDALIQQMKFWSYKTSDKKKIRAVLSQLTRIVDLAGTKEDKNSPVSYFSTTKDENKDSWDIDHIEPKKNANKESELNRIGNLVLLKADHNRIKKIATPLEKTDVYKGSHLLLTQSLASITVNHERSKVENYFMKAGITNSKWDLSDWNKDSMDARAELYGKLLKFHLMSFE